MIFLLPTRSTRRYRGAYPLRVNSWSYSRSSSQAIVADHLEIKRPIHFELNNGSRYIADMSALKPDAVRLSIELFQVLADHIDTDAIIELPQERYDAMLTAIRTRDELMSGIKL